MISVSRAAGYGKFTQTNDSHLPEARDTIEREGVKEKRESGWKKEEKRSEGAEHHRHDSR